MEHNRILFNLIKKHKWKDFAEYFDSRYVDEFIWLDKKEFISHFGNDENIYLMVSFPDTASLYYKRKTLKKARRHQSNI